MKQLAKFRFVRSNPFAPVYEVYGKPGHYFGEVSKSCDSSGTATRWRARCGMYSSDGWITRERAAEDLVRLARTHRQAPDKKA